MTRIRQLMEAACQIYGVDAEDLTGRQGRHAGRARIAVAAVALSYEVNYEEIALAFRWGLLLRKRYARSEIVRRHISLIGQSEYLSLYYQLEATAQIIFSAASCAVESLHVDSSVIHRFVGMRICTM